MIENKTIETLEFKHLSDKQTNRKDLPSLFINENEMRYKFARYYKKTFTDMFNAIIKRDFKVLLSRTKKEATLIMRLKDINDVQHNESQNTVWMSGKFTINYVNEKTDDERVVQYCDKLYCFEFPYVFENVEKFIKTINKHKQKVNNKDIPYPVSL